jgi:hypothetical protein
MEIPRKEAHIEIHVSASRTASLSGRCPPVCIALALLFNLEIACVVTIDNRLQGEIIFASERVFAR